MVARTGVGAEDFNLLQDTSEVVWGAFQGVVLRRLLDVVEPRVYIAFSSETSTSKVRHGMGAVSKDSTVACSDAYTRWTEERPTQTMVQSQHVVSLKQWVRIQFSRTHTTFRISDKPNIPVV